MDPLPYFTCNSVIMLSLTSLTRHINLFAVKKSPPGIPLSSVAPLHCKKLDPIILKNTEGRKNELFIKIISDYTDYKKKSTE